MQKRSKWEQNIKNKLENFKEPVPDFIWEDIQTEIPKENLFKRSMPVLRSIAAMAAIAIIATAVYFTTVSKPVKNINVAAIFEQENKNTKQTVLEDNSKDNLEVLQETGKHKLIANNITVAQNNINKTKGEITYMKSAEYVNNAQDDNQTNLSEKNDVNINEDVKEREETETREYSPFYKNAHQDSYSKDNYYNKHNKNRKVKNNKKWAIAVNAGNTFSSTATAVSGFSGREASMLLATNQISTYESMFVKADMKQPETYTKHHFPITGAITVRRYITDRISIETGIQYTMLRTDITSGANMKIVKKQRFQYLGVPIKVNYDLFKTKGFSIYTTAGGAFEGCISAKSYNEIIRDDELTKKNTENIDMKKIQLSVNAAVGLQFNPVDFMGIFAEPGITYFFNDGNKNISNIRQEHPLNFQLKAGLRFNF